MKHLPECPSTSTDPLAEDCCCARLHACQQRTLDAARGAVESEWSLDPMWEGTNWNNALSAAIAAIDALREKT